MFNFSKKVPFVKGTNKNGSTEGKKGFSFLTMIGQYIFLMVGKGCIDEVDGTWCR
jgi:hypothetical protein